MRTIQVTTSVIVPMVPNFLRTSDEQVFDVKDITDEGLREIGAAWIEDLIENARSRREIAKGDPS